MLSNPFSNPSKAKGPTPTTDTPPATDKVPYLSKGEDKYGRPYYGEGTKGYVTKIFANIFDPDNFVTKPTEGQTKIIEKGAEKGGEMLNEATGWDKWIGKWTGIQAEDVARSATAIRLTGTKTDVKGDIIEETGGDKAKSAIQAGAKGLWKGAGQMVKMGLDALSVVDAGVRKFQATNLAVDELANSSSVMPDITRFNDDSKVGHALNTLLRITPLVAGYNALRMYTNGKGIAENIQTVKDYQRGSSMVYTMFYDEARKQEYARRIQSGEDAGLVTAELEQPMVELAGSIFGDPTTYMGMGIFKFGGTAKSAIRIPFTKIVMGHVPWAKVGTVPGFSELLHLGVGKNRIQAVGNIWEKAVTPELDNALSVLQKVPDDNGALKAIKNVVETTRQSIVGVVDETGKVIKKGLIHDRGFVSNVSTAKADLMKKTYGTFFRSISATFKNGDDMGELMKAAKNITSTDNKLASEAFSTLSKYGNVPFSKGGLESLTFMSKLDDEMKIGTLIEKYGSDMKGLTEAVESKMFSVIDDTFPAVDEMADALSEFKKLKIDINDTAKIDKAIQNGTATAKQLELAKQYKNLPDYVKISSSVFKSINDNAVMRGLSSFFAGAFMGLSPGYAMRNLQSNAVGMWHDLGNKAGAEAVGLGVEAMFKSTGQRIVNKLGGNVDWMDKMAARELDKTAKLLGGNLPYMAKQGTGIAGISEGFGFLGVGQDIEKVHSAIITRHVVQTEMEKMLRYGFSPRAGLPKEAADRLSRLFLDNMGDTKAAITQFRKEIKAGEFETWRNLEVNPQFKDWLQKANVWDEVDDIRKTAANSNEFIEKMKAVVNKMDDLAQKVRNEPAMVAETNPMGEASVYIEKAFADSGTAMREEVNQFKALTQYWEDLRGAYTDVATVLRDKIVRMLPEAELPKFQSAYEGITHSFNEVVGSNRNLATDFYTKSHSADWKKGNPAELWDTVKGTVLDADGNIVSISLRQSFPDIDPTQLSKTALNNMAWRWVKDNQAEFWKNYNQSFIMKQDALLEETALKAGTTLEDLKMQAFQGLDNPKLKRIGDLQNNIKEWTEYIAPKSLEPFKDVPKGTKLSQMDLSSVNLEGGKTHLFNAVNKDRTAKGLDSYVTIDDVPFEEAVQSLKTRLKDTPIPPRVETTAPTLARQLYENMNGGGREAFDEFMTETVKKWGETTPLSNLGDDVENAVSAFAKEGNKRITEVRARAMAIADETRNFILHDYNKTYADKFMGMFLQYHYWPSRTYARWTERMLDTPGTLSAFTKWKSAMDKEHADMPEYYRYQVPIGKLPGLDNNPMYFNLEQTLNPLNGLMGSDYNDPYKRADWASSALDDMGKNGFSVFTPINWLMAAHLYKKGEDEAAQRWMGRLIPATATLKAALNKIEGATGKDITPDIGPLKGVQYGELDPFVNIFGGGMDPNEEKRVGRAMAQLIKQGVPKEQAFDALLKRDGELYDQAVALAINERGGGQIASYFLGLGYKARTEGDVMVENFYNEYYKLVGMRENISPEDYRDAMDGLKEKFPFADAVLLAKRGGDERDGAYAYNVLGRMPPGMSDDLLISVGVNRDLINKFYDDKGNFEGWSEQDKSRFMSAILDLGAMLKMPDKPTKEGWNDARDANKAIYSQVETELGAGVWDMVDAYYQMKDTDLQMAFQFKEAHPEITQALTRRQELLMQSPEAFPYFGSLDGVENYYSGRVRAQLKEEFGDLAPLWAQYFDLKLTDPRAAKNLWNANPQLKAYSEKKAILEAESNAAYISVAAQLPEREFVTLREDFEAMSAEQETLAQQLQQPALAPTWEQVLQTTGNDMSPSMQMLLQAYYQDGTELSKGAESQLEYLASRYGSQLGATNADSFLRMVGVAMAKQNQPPDPNQWANQTIAPSAQMLNPFGQ